MPGFFSAEIAGHAHHHLTAIPAAQSISMQLNGLSSKQDDTIETFRFIPSRRPALSNFLRLCQRQKDFARGLSPADFCASRTRAKSDAYAAFRIHAC
jgi:hypothetical protein